MVVRVAYETERHNSVNLRQESESGKLKKIGTLTITVGDRHNNININRKREVGDKSKS